MSFFCINISYFDIRCFTNKALHLRYACKYNKEDLSTCDFYGICRHYILHALSHYRFICRQKVIIPL